MHSIAPWAPSLRAMCMELPHEAKCRDASDVAHARVDKHDKGRAQQKGPQSGPIHFPSDGYGKRVETCPFALPFNRCSTAGAIGPTSLTAWRNSSAVTPNFCVQ